MMRHTTYATKPAPMPSMPRHLIGSVVNRTARVLVAVFLISLPLSGCGSSVPKPATATSVMGVPVTSFSADQVESERKYFDVIDVGDLSTRYGAVRANNSQILSGAELERVGVVTSYKSGSTGYKLDIKGMQWASRIESAVSDHEYRDSSDDWSATQKNTFHLLEQESSGVSVVSSNGKHISLTLQPHWTTQNDDFSTQRIYVVVLSAETEKFEGPVEVSGLILGRVLTNDSLVIQTTQNYYPRAEGQKVISVYSLSNPAGKPSIIPSDHWPIGASRDLLLLPPYPPIAGSDGSTRFRSFMVTQMGTDGTARRTITGVDRLYPGGWFQRFSDPAVAAASAANTAGKDDDQTRAVWNALSTQIVDLNSGSTYDLTGGKAESVGVPTDPGLLIRHEAADDNGNPQQLRSSVADDGHPHTENLEQFTSK